MLTLLGLYSWNQWADIKFVKNEIDGLHYYHPLEEIGGVVNVRSANIGVALSSGQSVDTAAADAEIDKLMSEMDVLDKEYGREESRAKWQAIHDSWAKLKASTFKDLSASLAAHESLNGQLADLRLHIATEWGMALDPIAESYYLLDLAVNKLPEIGNGIGVVRGYVAAAAHGAAQDSEIRLEMIRHNSIIEDRMLATIAALEVIHEKTAGDAAVSAKLATVDPKWVEQVRSWTTAVSTVASQGKTAGADYEALIAEGDKVPEVLDTVHDELMGATETMMGNRESGMLLKMAIGVALVLALCAAAMKLAHAVSWRIIGAIRRLSEISANITQGKFDNFIDADGGDEITALYASINKMQQQLLTDQQNRERSAQHISRLSGGLESSSANIMIADADNNIIYMNSAAKGMFGAIEGDLRKDLPGFDTNKLVGQSVDVFHKNPSHQRNLLAKLSGTHKAKFIAGGKHIGFTASPILDDKGQRNGTVVEWVDNTVSVQAEQEIDGVVDASLKGDLSKRHRDRRQDGLLRSDGEESQRDGRRHVGCR